MTQPANTTAINNAQGRRDHQKLPDRRESRSRECLKMAVLEMPPCRSFLGSSPLFQKKEETERKGQSPDRQSQATRRDRTTTTPGTRAAQTPSNTTEATTPRTHRRPTTQSAGNFYSLFRASFWVLPRMLGDLGGASTLKAKGSFCKKTAVLPHVVSETGASRSTITHGGFGHHQTQCPPEARLECPYS